MCKRGWSALSALVLVGTLTTSFSFAQETKLTDKALFDSSKLHIVEIEIDDDDWKKLCGQSRSFMTGFANPNQKPYTYFKGNVTVDGQKIESVGIRKKGFFGSADMVRPSLKIKFDEYVDQQPATGLDRLTLNNNKQDSAQVSQLLTYGICNKAGIHAPRVSLAKVSVNGKSLGIYSHVESVKQPFLKRHFEDATGNLYEGTLTDFYPKAIERIENKKNNKNNKREDIAALSNALWEEKFDAAKIEKLLDMDYFLKYWAIESLTGFWDGYASNQNNYFLYNHPANNKLYFIPWGADCTFQGGNPFSRRGGFGGGGTTPPPSAVLAQATITNRLYHTDGYPEKYKAAMNEVLNNAFNEEELLAKVDQIENLVKDDLHSAQRRFEQTLERTRKFIKERRKQIEEALKDSPVSIPEKPRKPSYNVEVGEVKASFTANWVDRPSALPKEETITLNLKLNDEVTELKEVKVVVKPGRVFRFGSRGNDDQPTPVQLDIRAKRVSDDERINLSFTIARNKFIAAKGKSVKFAGRMTEGTGRGGFGGFGRGQQIDATFKFDSVAVDESQHIKGSFTGTLTENRGGLFGRRD